MNIVNQITPLRNRFHESRIPDNASIVGMAQDIAALTSRELLDQYAVLASMPDDLDAMAMARITLTRNELLNRLALYDLRVRE